MRLNRMMGVKLKLLFVITMVLFGVFHTGSNGWTNGLGDKPVVNEGYVPKEGFVPDESTALLIARAILIKIYGQQQIDLEQPFRAKLKDGVWIVKGSIAKDMAGGVATIKISKSDGRVLYVHHGK